MKSGGKATVPAVDPRIADFRNFLWLAWNHLGLPEPTPVQYDIAEYVQNGPKRMVIEAFRGVGKSWVTSAFVVHQLLVNPKLNILVVSASKSRADDFSTFTLRLINEMPLLAKLRPRDGQRTSKIGFDVGPAPAAHAPSVKSVGITGQLTGSRADLIVSDDVESMNNSLTQGMRDRISESVKEFEAIVKPEGRIMFLGTPQTEMSLYNVLPERGYSVRVWPARFPTKSSLGGYSGRLSPILEEQVTADEGIWSKPTDPLRFNDEDLLERESSYGRSGFALQFMLDTTLSDSDRYPLKLSDLCVTSLTPDVGPQKVVWAANPENVWNELPNVGLAGDRFYRPMQLIGDYTAYQGSVMAIDPSGRGKDETAYSVVNMLNSQLFLLDQGGVQGGYDETTLELLAEVAKRNKVNMILVESNFGDGMFVSLLTPILKKIYPVTVEEIRSNKQKELRIIDTLEPVMNSHRLIVDVKVIENDFKSTQQRLGENSSKYQLFYQMSRITKDRGALVNDDRLDALGMACSYWVDQMARDVDEAHKEQKDLAFQKEIDKFMDSFGRGRKSGDSWIRQPEVLNR